MSKEPLPSIADDLAPPPRKKLDLSGLRPRDAVGDGEVAANSTALAQKWGASTQVQPTEPLPEPAPVTSIRGYIPQYLDDELSIRAAERRVTKTFLIMEALLKAGYRIDEIDLVQDRRRPRQKGNT